MPAGPLSPRHGAAAVWTGTEVLVVGGAAETPCPAGADCARPTTLLADGAAYDPVRRAWRAIAPAPAPIWAAAPVVVGDWVHVGRLAYDVAADRWSTVPAPPAGHETLAAAGDHLLAYAGSHENGTTGTGYVLVDGRWAPLPDDPLGPGFDRRLVRADGVLVLLDRELVPSPGSGRPALVRAAVLTDPFTDRAAWAPLPPGEAQYTDPVLVDGDRIVLPSPGRADGGEVNPWDRPYPFGGVLDLAGRTWHELPPTDEPAGVGAVGATSAVYTGHQGVVLDVARGRWLTTPPLPRPTTGPSVTAAGRDLFVFGGATDDGRLLEIGWLWTP